VNPPHQERIFNVPGAVLALAGLLCAIYVVQEYVLSEEQTNELLALFAFSPARYAEVVPPGLPAWWGPQLWSFVSYALFHANLSHLGFNLVWLFAFGPPIARRFGPSRFTLFCTVSAAAGAVAHLIAYPNEFAPMIGASAAISGMMAGAMRFVFQRGGPLGLLGRGEEESYNVPAASLLSMLRDPRIVVFIGVWFGVNLVFGLGGVSMPGTEGRMAWEAHIGGFLAGLLGFSLFDPAHPSPPALTDEGAPQPSGDQEPADRT
jgi:membrane associated rhomboid family serine protease